MCLRFCPWFCSPSAGQHFRLAVIMLLIKLPPFPLFLYNSSHTGLLVP